MHVESDHPGVGSVGVPSREHIAEYLDATTEAPEQADLIFVPGTRLREPAPIAATLLAKDVAPLVLATGGINKLTGANEADALRSALLDLGVSPHKILVEDRSTNTLENVLYGWELARSRLSGRPITDVVAVCKWMHSRRVLMTLKAHLPPGVRYYACTYAPEGVTRDVWTERGDRPSQATAVLANWNNLPTYLANGDIQEIVRLNDGGWA